MLSIKKWNRKQIILLTCGLCKKAIKKSYKRIIGGWAKISKNMYFTGTNRIQTVWYSVAILFKKNGYSLPLYLKISILPHRPINFRIVFNTNKMFSKKIITNGYGMTLTLLQFMKDEFKKYIGIGIHYVRYCR